MVVTKGESTWKRVTENAPWGLSWDQIFKGFCVPCSRT